MASMFLQAYRQRKKGEWMGLYATYSNIATCFLKSGNLQQALVYFARVVMEEPDKPKVAVLFHQYLHYILAQIITAAWISSSEIPSSVAEVIQKFISSTLSLSKLDL